MYNFKMQFSAPNAAVNAIAAINASTLPSWVKTFLIDEISLRSSFANFTVSAVSDGKHADANVSASN